jgi:hypothetical protein
VAPAYAVSDSSVCLIPDCFFRAVLRAFVPLLDEPIELELSMVLRNCIVKNTDIRLDVSQASVHREEADDGSGASPGPTTLANRQQANGGDDNNNNNNSNSNGNGDTTTPVKRTRSQLDEFMAEGVDDGATMAQGGVWASHVQVVQTAAFLERRVVLLRPDDRRLDCRLQSDARRSRLAASDTYTIAPPRSRARRSVTLLYSPWPGHYDAAVPRSLLERHTRILWDDLWGTRLALLLAHASIDACAAAKLGSFAFDGEPDDEQIYTDNDDNDRRRLSTAPLSLDVCCVVCRPVVLVFFLLDCW